MAEIVGRHVLVARDVLAVALVDDGAKVFDAATASRRTASIFCWMEGA